MKKILFFCVAILLLSCSAHERQSIELGVEHTVRIPVEYVTVSVGIAERGGDASATEQEGFARLEEVVELLADSGFDRESMEILSGDVSQSNYNREIDFRFNSSITFDVFDLDQIDALRRAVTQVGATSFRITSYGNTEEDSIYNDAYQQALNSAKEHAGRLLENETVIPGKILNLRENIQEVTDVKIRSVSSPQSVDINISAGLSMTPLFNKEFYTREIVFNVEFELVNK